MIKIKEWYVGEPSDFASNGHSYYDNPKDWKNKLKRVEELISKFSDYVYLGSRSSWGCDINEKDTHDLVFHIDYWEDEYSMDDQLDGLREYLSMVYK